MKEPNKLTEAEMNSFGGVTNIMYHMAKATLEKHYNPKYVLDRPELVIGYMQVLATNYNTLKGGAE